MIIIPSSSYTSPKCPVGSMGLPWDSSSDLLEALISSWSSSFRCRSSLLCFSISSSPSMGPLRVASSWLMADFRLSTCPVLAFWPAAVLDNSWVVTGSATWSMLRFGESHHFRGSIGADIPILVGWDKQQNNVPTPGMFMYVVRPPLLGLPFSSASHLYPPGLFLWDSNPPHSHHPRLLAIWTLQ